MSSAAAVNFLSWFLTVTDLFLQEGSLKEMLCADVRKYDPPGWLKMLNIPPSIWYDTNNDLYLKGEKPTVNSRLIAFYSTSKWYYKILIVKKYGKALPKK